MALKEYKPGQAFHGVIGRTFDVSKPALAERRTAPVTARRTFCSSCSTTPASGSSAATAARSARPTSTALAAGRAALHQHAHHGAVLAVALVHAHRAQPPLQRHGVHHRGLDGLSGLQRLHPVRERLPVRDPAAARLQHVRRRQVAPDAGGADVGAPGRTTAGRWAAASSATTASSAATRTSTIPSWSATTIQVEPQKTPEEGYHLTADLADKAIAIHRRRQAGRARQAVLHVLLHRRATRAAPRAQGVGGQVQGQVRRRLGRLPRAGVRAGRRSWASSPQGRRAVAPRSRRAGLGQAAPTDERKLYARMMEVFAGFLEHTDHYIGAPARLPRGDRRATRTR